MDIQPADQRSVIYRNVSHSDLFMN